MKRYLFIITLFFSFYTGLYAQQLRPKASPLQVDEVYYLYNVQKDGFLVGGNSWNTQASIARDHANKIIVRKAIIEGQLWDGETYYITDSVETGSYYSGVFRRLFIETDKNVFIDQLMDGELDVNGMVGTSINRDNQWIINPSASFPNAYTISPSPNNKTFNTPSLRLSVDNVSQTILPIIGVFESSQNRNCDWYFVKPEDAFVFFQAKKEERKRQKQKIMEQIINKFDIKSIPTEEIVYMYNLSLDAFLVGDHLYETQASLSQIHANKVILHKYFDEGGQWDGKSYLITDSVEMGAHANKYRNMFIRGDGLILVDQRGLNSHLDHIWSITPSNRFNGAFQIHLSNLNRVFTQENLPNYKLGCEEGQQYGTPVISMTSKNENSEWMFLTLEQYQKVMQGHFRQELQDFIFDIKETYPNIDITTFQQLCDSPNTTNADINNAIGTLRLILFNEGNNNNIETSFTKMIMNPDFRTFGNTNWNMAYNVEVGTLTWWGGKTDSNPCAEAYQAVYDFWQEVRGIPNGLYRIDVQAFARTRVVDLAFIERDSSFIVPVIYANDMEMPIQDLMKTTYAKTDDYAFLQTEEIYENMPAAVLLMDGTYVPFNQWAASSVFEEGLYDQSVYCHVTDGSIRIGIRETNKRTGSWTAWDNFRLTYLPETSENYQKAVNTYSEKAQEIERLAIIKNVDATDLTQAINEADKVIQSSDIKGLNLALTALNQQIINVRERIKQKEFAADATFPIYLGLSQVDQDVEETDDERADSTTILSDMAESFDYIATMLYGHEYEEKGIEVLSKAYVLYETLQDYSHAGINKGKIGLIFYYQSNFDAAERSFWESIHDFEKNNDTHNMALSYTNLSRVKIQTKDFIKAEDFARKAIELDNDVMIAHRNLAEALLLQGKYQDAKEIYLLYKDYFMETGLGFEDDEKDGIIPKERKTDVEKIKKLFEVE